MEENPYQAPTAGKERLQAVHQRDAAYWLAVFILTVLAIYVCVLLFVGLLDFVGYLVYPFPPQD